MKRDQPLEFLWVFALSPRENVGGRFLPSPKGEGCVSDFGPLCPAEDMGKGQPQGRGLGF